MNAMTEDGDEYAKRRREWFDVVAGFTCAMGFAVIFWTLLVATP